MTKMMQLWLTYAKKQKNKIQLSGVEHSRPFFTIQGKTYRLDISRESFEAASKTVDRTYPIHIR